MKKIFTIIVIYLSFIGTSFATCSIESSNTVCSLPNLRKKVSPIYTHNSTVKELSSSPAGKLEPINRGNIKEQLKDFSPQESGSNYNSSCQFGVCLQNKQAPLFQQQNK